MTLLLAAALAATTYLTTIDGGQYGAGSVIDQRGNIIYSFCATRNYRGYCSDGYKPLSVQELADGTLVGVTERGGLNNIGAFFWLTQSGTSWILTGSYSMCWYWGDCNRYGYFDGPLVPASPVKGSTAFYGTVGDKRGRGLTYEFVPEDGNGWSVSVIKHWH